MHQSFLTVQVANVMADIINASMSMTVGIFALLLTGTMVALFRKGE